MAEPIRDSDYDAALHSVASRVGLRPEEFERELQKEAENLVVTPYCLTLGELDPTYRLTGERQKHVRECDFCRMLLLVVTPSRRKVDDFVREAVGAKAGRVPKLATVEREMIIRALQAHAGDTRRAADDLGVTTLGLLWRQFRHKTRSALG